MKIYFYDGGRYNQNTGYGMVSRSIIIALRESTEKLYINASEKTRENDFDPLAKKPNVSLWSGIELPPDVDLVVQVGQPLSIKKWPIQSIAYTMIDVDGVPDAWLSCLNNADAIITPSKQSADAIAKKYKNAILVVPLYSDANIFKPRQEWRSEGFNKKSFIYAGTFSFRKGVDILIDSFIQEFDHDEASLTIFSSESEADNCFSMILSRLKYYSKIADINVITKKMSEQWICRIYNRHDYFVSFTRGEGWGYTAYEAALSGLPVIATDNTSMNMFLDRESTIFAHSAIETIDDMDSSFGGNFKKTYSGNELSCTQVSVSNARAALRLAFNEFDKLKSKALLAREKHYSIKFSECRFVEEFSSAVSSLIAKSRIIADSAVNNISLKLEIGSGSNPREGYVHHDIRDLPDIDIVCDARNFPTEHIGRYSEVYASNILEHFDRFEIEGVFTHWVSLLKRGGVIKIIVPDMLEISRQFYLGYITAKQFSYLCYGGHDYEFNVHHYGFSPDSLRSLMESNNLEIVHAKAGIPFESKKVNFYCPMIEVHGRLT